MGNKDRARPGANLANLAGMAAAAGQEARVVAARRRLLTVRLTDQDRRICSDELAEQFALGRLDEQELDRRVDLLHAAVTHGDLIQVFAGLPLPPLYAQEPRKPGRWRWAAFVGAVWLAVPFVLIGLVFLVFGREIAAAIFGVPALAWVYFAWRWASGRRSRPKA
ncbi:MAG: hypothetical protein QOG10_4456 [Kribbellaceae bacterium]|jgi:hypothetical protein|nr:hypothetical protein [Kribbellaceae bacterium]